METPLAWQCVLSFPKHSPSVCAISRSEIDSRGMANVLGE